MKPTRKDIEDLARHDPIVRRCYDLWRMEYLTWEEAMMGCVIALQQAHGQAIKNLKMQMDYSTRPYVKPE